MVISSLKVAKESTISHGTSSKFVFEEEGWHASTVTQAAIGVMRVDENCAFHFHETMTEVFYFISGFGKYIVNNKEFVVEAGVYLRIDPGEIHKLVVLEELRFFYLGIVTK